MCNGLHISKKICIFARKFLYHEKNLLIFGYINDIMCYGCH